jgi:hypothetical protein
MWEEKEMSQVVGEVTGVRVMAVEMEFPSLLVGS